VRVPRRFEAIVFVTASAQDVSVGSRDALTGLVHDNDQPPRCVSSGEGQVRHCELSAPRPTALQHLQLVA
jgi:hypothetical protein